MSTKRKQELDRIFAAMKAIQDAHAGKAMPEAEAAKFDALALEGKTIQDELDRERRMGGIKDSADALKIEPIAPDDTPAEKATQPGSRPKIAGYLTIGQYLSASKGLADFIAQGMPKTAAAIGSVRGFKHKVVGLTEDQLRAAVKAVPTLGEGVIEPTRLGEIVRVTEQDRLNLRDVLNVQPTGSDAVHYTRLVSYTRAAATVAHSAAKPQAALELDAQTQTVRTIAVWIPVENQQLADLPALAGLIDNELSYDVRKHEEELVMYGSGVGTEFTGILVDPAVLEARSEAGDTLIDIARRGITDVRRAGYEPNAIVADPLDWETIVLEKGSDNRYVWVVVTEGATQRLWGVPVIETVAMENFNGDDVEQRHLVVGDFRRGATLWDREQLSIQVGWINDQFIKNQRTILAEERAAFGVLRPGAFRKYETQEAANS